MAAELSTASAICFNGPSNGQSEQRHQAKVRRHRLGALGATAIALLTLVSTKAVIPIPTLLWNASPSVPTGLYMTILARPAKGKLAVIRLADPVRSLADRRGYLPRSAVLIKPVVAADGDTVCRRGSSILINGDWVANAKARDTLQRSLPQWQGCNVLAASEVFVLSTAGDSFDSRYIGPINTERVLGTGAPLWTTGD